MAKLNVPWDEVDAFTEQVKEREMGELFKYFESWDIQEVRREAKEEVEKAKEEAKEESIQKFLKGIKKYHASREEAITELMEEYELSQENAAEKVAMYW